MKMKKFVMIALLSTLPFAAHAAGVSLGGSGGAHVAGNSGGIGVGANTGVGVNAGSANVGSNSNLGANVDTGVNTGIHDNEGRDSNATVNTSSGSTFDNQEHTTATNDDAKINAGTDTKTRKKLAHKVRNTNRSARNDIRQMPASLKNTTNGTVGVNSSTTATTNTSN
jgi:hypothetical protein